MSNGVEVEDAEESPGFPPVAAEANGSTELVESPEFSQDGVYRGGILRLQIPPPAARAPLMVMPVPHSGDSIGGGVASDDMSSLASACLSPASSASTGAASSITPAQAQHYHAMMAGMTPLRPHFLPVPGYPGMESELSFSLDG